MAEERSFRLRLSDVRLDAVDRSIHRKNAGRPVEPREVGRGLGIEGRNSLGHGVPIVENCAWRANLVAVGVGALARCSRERPCVRAETGRHPSRAGAAGQGASGLTPPGGPAGRPGDRLPLRQKSQRPSTAMARRLGGLCELAGAGPGGRERLLGGVRPHRQPFDIDGLEISDADEAEDRLE